MANVIFESGTQAQAAALTADDTLLFETTSPTDVTVTFNPASGFQTATTTLSAGGQTLTFAAAELQDATLSFFSAAGSLEIGGATGDTLTLSGDDASAAWGLGGADTIGVAGDGAHAAHGGLGNDTIAATGNGDYVLYGNDDNDVISNTGTGNLVIEGGLGTDSITAGAGNDHLYGNTLAPSGTVADGADTILAGAGSDYVNGNAGTDSIDGGAGSDRLLGGQGNDTILGGADNDSVNGNLGDDSIDGGTGNDSLRGGQGDDTVTGGTGNDVVLGDLGNDVVSGDGGIDIVTGGAGADVFTFAAGDAAVGGLTTGGVTYYDTVTDYTDGEDTIDLGVDVGHVLYVASATYAGTSAGLAAARAAAEAKLASAGDAGDVVAVTVGSDTFLFFDGDGATTTVDSAIKLAGVTDASIITTADFVAVV